MRFLKERAWPRTLNDMRFLKEKEPSCAHLTMDRIQEQLHASRQKEETHTETRDVCLDMEPSE